MVKYGMSCFDGGFFWHPRILLKKPWIAIIVSILFTIAFSAIGTNIMWPSLRITNGLSSLPVTLAGLVVGILFVKYFTKAEWLKTIKVAFFMSLAVRVVGVYLGIFFVLSLELIFYYNFGYAPQTFSWSHWALAYIITAFINTLIEGGVVRLTLKLKLENTFRWVFLANTINMIICAIYVHFISKHL
jgi:hypothetical protein